MSVQNEPQVFVTVRTSVYDSQLVETIDECLTDSGLISEVRSVQNYRNVGISGDLISIIYTLTEVGQGVMLGVAGNLVWEGIQRSILELRKRRPSSDLSITIKVGGLSRGRRSFLLEADGDEQRIREALAIIDIKSLLPPAESSE